MKVLMFNDNDPSSVLGGTEVYIERLSALLKARGVKVYSFFMSDKRNVHEADRRVFELVAVGMIRRYVRRIYFYRALYLALRTFVNKVQPDVVHMHNNYRYPVTVLFALRGFTIVQTVHDYCAIFPTAPCCEQTSCAKGPIILALKHGCMKVRTLVAEGWLLYGRCFIDRLFVKCFIAPSHDLERELNSKKYKHVMYIPNFAPDVNIHTQKVSKNIRIILYVGSLVKHKGVDVLVRAFQQMKQEERTELWIVGIGPEMEKLQKSTLGSPIVFMGRCTQNQVLGFYRDANVVVIPSLWLENAPLVAYEALSQGKVIVASRVGGLPELVEEGVNGYTFTRGDTHQLREVLEHVLSDPQLQVCTANGSHSRERRAESHIDKLLDIYKQAHV